MAKKSTSGGGSPQDAYRANQADYAGQYSNPAEFGQVNSAYAAPSHMADAPYIDTPGWNPALHVGVAGTPDAMRINEMPVRYFAPRGGEVPGVFYGMRDADANRRHVAESQDADGWTIRKDSYKVGRNPRETPPPETRPTEKMSPANYSFTRPFDQFNRTGTDGAVGTARHLNGMHWSMADHKRTYEVLGMQPWSKLRNTYRVDPAPWDSNMIDIPPGYDPTPNQIQAVDVPASTSRSYRLGG